MNQIEQIKQNHGGKLPKILVGAPTNAKKEYILDRYITRLKELTYPDYEILLSDNSFDDKFKEKIESYGIKCLKTKWNEKSKHRIADSRNQLRQYALDNNFDYYLSVEADVIPPTDIIEKMLIWNKRIIGGWYYIGEASHARPCLSQEWKEIGGENIVQASPTAMVMAKERLMKVFLGSMGIMLIHHEVLQNIPFRCFEHFSHHDDTWFFFDCESKGYEVWIDTELLVPHFQAPNQWAGENLI